MNLKRKRKQKTIKVKILSKPDCHLCDTAKKVIQQIQQTLPFILEEVDITCDSDLFDKYKEHIPVIFINERKAFKYHVAPEEFKRRLQRLI